VPCGFEIDRMLREPKRGHYVVRVEGVSMLNLLLSRSAFASTSLRLRWTRSC